MEPQRGQRFVFRPAACSRRDQALGRQTSYDRRSQGRAAPLACPGQHWPALQRSGGPGPCSSLPQTTLVRPPLCPLAFLQRVVTLHDAICRDPAPTPNAGERLSEQSRTCPQRGLTVCRSRTFGLLLPHIPAKSTLGALLVLLFR